MAELADLEQRLQMMSRQMMGPDARGITINIDLGELLARVLSTRGDEIRTVGRTNPSPG